MHFLWWFTYIFSDLTVIVPSSMSMCCDWSFHYHEWGLVLFWFNEFLTYSSSMGQSPWKKKKTISQFLDRSSPHPHTQFLLWSTLILYCHQWLLSSNRIFLELKYSERTSATLSTTYPTYLTWVWTNHLSYGLAACAGPHVMPNHGMPNLGGLTCSCAVKKASLLRKQEIAGGMSYAERYWTQPLRMKLIWSGTWTHLVSWTLQGISRRM